jgi:hypothetical protein
VKLKNLYKRLSRRSSLFYRYSLWAGPDHLLYISGTTFSENYKRFYFQDIQSIIILKTAAWKVWNWLLGSLGVLFVLMAVSAEGAGVLPATIAAGFMIVMVFINYLLGPTCACYIQTAVQKERLRSLSRIQKAQQIMDSLKPQIHNAQRKRRQRPTRINRDGVASPR